MGINVSQFNPPGTVSNLVWDDDMIAGAGKIFKGDLTGNVTGNVTGNATGDVVGDVNGYLLRSGVVNASSGVLIVPAGSSTGNAPVTIQLNGNGTSCINNDNILKSLYPSPCTIPVSLSTPPTGYNYENNAYARSYDANGVLIDSVGNGGNLNIYGATYIILNGGTSYRSDGYHKDITISVANAYIDADTTVIPGMINPPTNGVFTGDVVGNVTGNVTGDVIATYRMTPKTPYVYTKFTSGNVAASDALYTTRDSIALYNVLPNQLLTGTINAYYAGGMSGRLRFLNKGWGVISDVNLTNVAHDYTIPAGTNCIILLLRGGYQDEAKVSIATFDIAVV